MFLRILTHSFCKIAFVEFWFGALTIILDVLEEIIRKIIESRYIGICSIIGKIIDIENDRGIIENLSLLKKMTYRPPLVANALHRFAS